MKLTDDDLKPVRLLIRNEVTNPYWIKVNNQVMAQVWDQIRFKIITKINETI